MNAIYFENGYFQQFLLARNPCNWNILKLKFLTLIQEAYNLTFNPPNPGLHNQHFCL